MYKYITMKTSTCQQCNTSFILKPGTFGKFCSLSCSTSYRNKQLIIQKHTKYQLNPKLCLHCRLPMSYNKRNNQYCSSSCSAKVTNKVQRKRGPIKQYKPPYTKIKFLWCSITHQWYVNKNPDGTTRRSSPYTKTLKQQYYWNARFRFNVYNFPEEFDLSLIQKYGWYTCPRKNHKNLTKNINGISRDHLISISYGFANNIDSNIISHPANCTLMIHADNYSKGVKCSITLEELMHRIKIWDNKYALSE